jgi:SHS2 domain-containing protein
MTGQPASDAAVAYFPHGADVGVIGRGATIEEALMHAAEATFAITCDSASIRPAASVTVSFTEDDPEFALPTWLNLLLSEARVAGLALGRFELQREGDVWSGQAWGEPWREGIEPGVEVKGATLTGLSVRHDGERWEARCVVDV